MEKVINTKSCHSTYWGKKMHACKNAYKLANITMPVTADQHKHHHPFTISQSVFMLCIPRDSRANISTVVYHTCIVHAKLDLC